MSLAVYHSQGNPQLEHFPQTVYARSLLMRPISVRVHGFRVPSMPVSGVVTNDMPPNVNIADGQTG